MDLASTDIRRRLLEGKAIDEMVRENVLAFIIRKRLYQSSTQK
jgi:nicotinic acid mononucleotide adenylyltransferase